MSAYRTIEVRRIAGALGAEIHGVDLAGALPDETVAEIRRAFLEHLVIFFRGQTLTPAEFMAFARRMGKPIEYPFVKGIEGFPEVIEVKKLEHERQNFGGIWHSDTAYLAIPPMGSMLLAELNRAEALRQQRAATADLFRALGGGWTVPAEATPAAVSQAESSK